MECSDDDIPPRPAKWCKLRFWSPQSRSSPKWNPFGRAWKFRPCSLRTTPPLRNSLPRTSASFAGCSTALWSSCGARWIEYVSMCRDQSTCFFMSLGFCV
eukprot:s59_g69.t1